MQETMKRVVRWTALAMACLAACGAHAQSAWVPTKPIKIIVPYPAGGTADAIPRIVSEKLQAMWGQTVLVDNRPGANGNIGAEAAFRADPDGYTLLATPPGPLAVNASLYKKLNYNVSQFVPVSVLASMPTVLAVRSSMPVTSVAQLIDAARKSPGSISFASQGSGSTSHLTGAMFQLRTNTTLTHVPYKGSAPALSDLAGGQVDMMFDNISSTLAQYKAGRVKVLGVATNKRLASIPEVPTMIEAGVPDFLSGTWVAVVAPPGTPVAISSALSKAMAEIVKMPDVQKRFADLGGESVGGTPDEVGRFIGAEAARWHDVIQKANVSID